MRRSFIIAVRTFKFFLTRGLGAITFYQPKFFCLESIITREINLVSSLMREINIESNIMREINLVSNIALKESCGG